MSSTFSLSFHPTSVAFSDPFLLAVQNEYSMRKMLFQKFAKGFFTDYPLFMFSCPQWDSYSPLKYQKHRNQNLGQSP